MAGVTITHQIEDANHPILLSIDMQSKLGFIKDVIAGTIKLLDYPDARLEIVRQVGTGLFMVRIDHLNPYALLNYPTLPKGILLHQWQKDSYMRRMSNEKDQATNKPAKTVTAMMGWHDKRNWKEDESWSNEEGWSKTKEWSKNQSWKEKDRKENKWQRQSWKD